MKREMIYCSKSYGERSEIAIESSLLSKWIPEKSLLRDAKVVIITDDQVLSLYGEKIKELFSKGGFEVFLFSFIAGEKSKTRATKEALENQLFEKKIGRDSFIVSLGGGVVSDLAGYIAATYCRGIPFLSIPTTLMGMVDASIGGKVGVNTPYGKNMVGAIYQPKKILIDPECLKTLPLRELKNGLVECIKHSLIGDSSYFDYLCKEAEAFLRLDHEVTEKVIFESCRLKKEIVEEDEREEGKRRLLNFGHTIGHALEKLTAYSIRHGEAVAVGIVVESYLSMKMGHLDLFAFEKIKSIFLLYDISLTLPHPFSVEEWMDAMRFDKKVWGGSVRFVLIDKIGSALSLDGLYCSSVEEDLLKEVLEEMTHALRCH